MLESPRRLRRRGDPQAPSSGGRNGCPDLLWLQVVPSDHLCSVPVAPTKAPSSSTACPPPLTSLVLASGGGDETAQIRDFRTGEGAGRGTEGWSYPDQQELARSDRGPGEAAAECG